MTEWSNMNRAEVTAKVQPNKENLEWLRSQKASNSAIINELLDEARKDT